MMVENITLWNIKECSEYLWRGANEANKQSQTNKWLKVCFSNCEREENRNEDKYAYLVWTTLSDWVFSDNNWNHFELLDWPSIFNWKRKKGKEVDNENICIKI